MTASLVAGNDCRQGSSAVDVISVAPLVSPAARIRTWRWYALLMISKVKDSNRKRRVGRISTKNQVTLPVAALQRAHLGAGSRVVIEAEGPGRIVVRGVDDDFDRFVGCVTGVWRPGALDDLRNEWR